MATKDVDQPVSYTLARSFFEPRAPGQVIFRADTGKVEVHDLPGAQRERHETCRDDSKRPSIVRLRLPRVLCKITLGAGDDIPHCGVVLGGDDAEKSVVRRPVASSGWTVLQCFMGASARTGSKRDLHWR